LTALNLLQDLVPSYEIKKAARYHKDILAASLPIEYIKI